MPMATSTAASPKTTTARPPNRTDAGLSPDRLAVSGSVRADVTGHSSKPWPPQYGPSYVLIFTHAQSGVRQTETWLPLSPVNGVPAQSATRRSSSIPASRAIRSHSAGQM